MQQAHRIQGTLFFLFISFSVCRSSLSLTNHRLSFCSDQNLQGVSVLHLAAFFGSLPIVQILVGAGAQVPAQDSTFSTQPLHWAAMGGHTPIVEYLLDTGAPQLAQTEKGTSLSSPLPHSRSLALLYLRMDSAPHSKLSWPYRDSEGSGYTK